MCDRASSRGFPAVITLVVMGQMTRPMLLLVVVVMTTPITGDQSSFRLPRSSGHNDVINDDGKAYITIAIRLRSVLELRGGGLRGPGPLKEMAAPLIARFLRVQGTREKAPQRSRFVLPNCPMYSGLPTSQVKGLTQRRPAVHLTINYAPDVVPLVCTMTIVCRLCAPTVQC